MPSGLVPKRLAWQPLSKAKMKGTLFLDLDQSKEDDPHTDVDFSLLQEMFCRNEEEVKAEEEKRRAAEKKQQSEQVKRVIEAKQI